MNWIHSSKAITLGVLLAVSLAAVGTAAALTIDGGQPEPVEVGDTVTHEVTINEPFREQPDQWTLNGETGLENASWTVREVAQGDPVNTESPSGGSFDYSLDRSDGATEVTVEVTGQVPDLTQYNYQDMEAENYTAIALSQGDAELETFTGHRYTTGSGDAAGSQQARQAIDEAAESAGEDNQNVQRAISSYNNGNFGNAVSLADEAESGAQSSQLLMIGAGVVVLLALIGGGVYYWRQRQDKGYKLQ